MKDKTPYVVVALQEAARMNTLLTEMRQSMEELLLGLGGSLNMSDKMEKLAMGMSHHMFTIPQFQHTQPSWNSLGQQFCDIECCSLAGIATNTVPALWMAQVSTRYQEVFSLTSWYMVSKGNVLPCADDRQSHLDVFFCRIS